MSHKPDPAPIIIPADVLLHLAALPFCGIGDPACPCRSDEEARRLVEGRTV